MNNKKDFAMGFIIGVAIMILGIIGYGIYDTQVRWGGNMSPNRKVQEIFSRVDNHSILPFDRAEMIENMYRGLLAGVGDPYTRYFDLESLEVFRTRTQGVFVGIGVRVVMDPTDHMLTLVNVFRDSPAGQAGLLPGDKVLSVDGLDMMGRSQQEILDFIRGPAGTTVNITVLRPYESKIFDVDIIRAHITVPTVHHEMIQTDAGLTGYVRIEGFEEPTYAQFAAALAELTYKGMDSLIVDVRNNPGGLLDSVVDIANLLIPEGTVTFLEDANGRRRYHNSDYSHLGIPLVVLINERSASASEVLGGAVQDTGVGALVGEQTFGKGIVQSVFELSDGTAIKLTIAQYFTPNGRPVHDVGLTPDFIVEMDEVSSRMIGELELTEDPQLQMALRVVRLL